MGVRTHGEPGANVVGQIKGNLHGGQAPIVGSHVYLFSPHDGPGSSTSLLQRLTTGKFPTAEDASGNYYVTTDAGGNFELNGAYTCTYGTQVYALATGGDAGGGVSNPAIGLMAALGECPQTGTLADQVPYIEINEVSTVAMAFAVAGFSSGATAISNSANDVSRVGIEGAFATVTNLIDPASGTAVATTPGGTGTPPRALLNSIANSLAACVNSTPSDSVECDRLFNATPSGGTSGGTYPTETATAAINVAHHPAAYVSTIFGLAAGTGTPFQPALASAPNDFTMGIQYAGSGIMNTNSLDVDYLGNLWLGALTGEAGNATYTVSEMSRLGVLATGSPFASGTANGGVSVKLEPGGDVYYMTQFELGELSSTGYPLSPAGGLSFPEANAVYDFAVGGYGYLWISNYDPGHLILAAPRGPMQQPATEDLPGVLAPSAIAFDNVGNAWVGGEGGGSQLNAYTAFGFPLQGSPYTGNGLSDGGGVSSIAVTAFDNVFTVQGSTLSEFTTTGAAVASGLSGGGLLNGGTMIVDGSSHLWIAPINTAGGPAGIAEFDAAGNAVSPDRGLNAASFCGDIAIDGSGNVWVAQQQGPLLELVGAATPVRTPRSLAVGEQLVGKQP